MRFQHNNIVESKIILTHFSYFIGVINSFCVTGNPTPNITWFKNDGTPIVRSYGQPSYGKWSLLLEELTKSDDGNYTCVICNRLGCINHTQSLLVQGMCYFCCISLRLITLLQRRYNKY